MAHKARSGGTVYEIGSGRAMTNGTSYDIGHGKTLVNGTGYDINMSGLPSVGTSLNNMTWEEIRMISDAGLAASYFSIGDRKAVTLNGAVGDGCTFNNATYYCFIIGIDHNSSKEGTNRIHFQFGYTALSGGTNVAFADSQHYQYVSSGAYFVMYNTDSNTGGWGSSIFKTIICPAFKMVMPSDLQLVLKTVTKYSNNAGGKSSNAENITSTTEEVFLLSEYEVLGSQYYGPATENSYMAQYAYYAAGNTKVKYKHGSTSTATRWMLRSVQLYSTGYFCVVETDGNIYRDYSDKSTGFAPAFCV